MSQEPPVHETHHENAIDHFEEEFKNLEGMTRFGRPIRIIVGVVIAAAVVAVAVWWVASPPPVTSARLSYLPATTGSPIDVVEPKGTTLAEPPSRFAWESVTGRLQYVVRIYVKGTSVPVLERMVTTPSVDLTSDERARMPRGKTYVWTVVAQGKDGSTIGSGQSTFKVR